MNLGLKSDEFPDGSPYGNPLGQCLLRRSFDVICKSAAQLASCNVGEDDPQRPILSFFLSLKKFFGLDFRRLLQRSIFVDFQNMIPKQPYSHLSVSKNLYPHVRLLKL